MRQLALGALSNPPKNYQPVNIIGAHFCRAAYLRAPPVKESMSADHTAAIAMAPRVEHHKTERLDPKLRGLLSGKV
jgi:hypothetical protein